MAPAPLYRSTQPEFSKVGGIISTFGARKRRGSPGGAGGQLSRTAPLPPEETPAVASTSGSSGVRASSASTSASVFAEVERRGSTMRSASSGMQRSTRKDAGQLGQAPAVQFTIEVAEEEEAASDSALQLQQEYDAITVLAAAHMLHGRGIHTREEAGKISPPEVPSLQLPGGSAVEATPGAGAALQPLDTGRSSEHEELLREHTSLFLDALRKVSAMQAQSVAARDKVLHLGRHYRQQCRKSRELERKLQDMTAERDELLRQRERTQRSQMGSSDAWDEIHRSLQLERGRRRSLEAQLEALTAEHDELMARDLLQSQALQRSHVTEQELAHQLAQSLAEQVRFAAALSQERSSRERTQSQLARLAPAAADRERLARSLHREREGKRKLRERLESLTAAHDEEVLEEMFCQGGFEDDGMRPCRAA